MIKIKKIDVEHAQYFMRQSYEEGFRAAGGSSERSEMNPRKGKWFDFWLNSKTRKTLVDNGIISGEETWR